MSLNWREIALITSELPLQDSVLQNVVQHSFNALSWHFYHHERGRWILYTEVGTPHSRLHSLSEPMTEKTAKLQRFIQFCRAHLIGSRITSCYQYPYDRLLRLGLDKRGTLLLLFIRLYSGSAANIIVTDEAYTILDLLLRRPRRNEVSGQRLEIPEERVEQGPTFEVRQRTADSFNRQIEAEYRQVRGESDLQTLLERARTQGERELERLKAAIIGQLRSLEAVKDFEALKRRADLLSANAHLLGDSSTSIDLLDWESGTTVSLSLDARLKGREQIEHAYGRYQKAKGAYEHAQQELERLKAELASRTQALEALLSPKADQSQWIAELRAATERGRTVEVAPQSPGLTITSGPFTLLVGRNAKENDELLRHHSRGNDWWVHARGFGGGYVFIKAIRGKSVPLDVLLDAATLAIHYSKARSSGKAELYYTQVKYLRRAKGGKQGLVIPTQEKNLSVVLDEERLRRLLLTHDNT